MATPPHLLDRFADQQWTLAYQYPGHSVVYRLSGGGAPDRFLKICPNGDYPGVDAEAPRMQWVSAFLRVPEVLEVGREGAEEWILTTALPGLDGTRSKALGREALTRALARGLRTMHDALPVAACPFDFRLGPAIEHVRRRVERNEIDPARAFHPEFAHLDVEGALARLLETLPTSEDLVVCHGDYCLPNMLLEEGEVTGYLDLGELGVADRWWDLAVATWSLDWNLGEGLRDLFLEEYGAELDPGRLEFYRLLYDLVG